jgi:hypothetical protein
VRKRSKNQYRSGFLEFSLEYNRKIINILDSNEKQEALEEECLATRMAAMLEFLNSSQGLKRK